MHRTITPEKLSYYAYINFDAVKEPVRGVVVEFIGLGGNGMYTEDTARGKRFGEMGFYYVLPYLNPWNWMNDQAVRTTDCILDGLVRLHGEILPVISTGGQHGRPERTGIQRQVPPSRGGLRGQLPGVRPALPLYRTGRPAPHAGQRLWRQGE